jgi:hypothetical protein
LSFLSRQKLLKKREGVVERETYMWRVDLGFLFCAFALPILVLVTDELSVSALAAAGFMAILTGGATLLGALPLYTWCRKRRLFALWPFLGGGALTGLLIATMLGSIFFMMAGGGVGWQFSLVLVCIGAIHGTLFWLIAICRNEALRGFQANEIESSDAGPGG